MDGLVELVNEWLNGLRSIHPPRQDWWMDELAAWNDRLEEWMEGLVGWMERWVE